MLPREHRLPMRNGFTPQFQTRTQFFAMKGRKNDLSVSRFAIIVSKQVDKRATVRNHIKRLFRQFLHERLLKIQPGYDMLFIATKRVQKGQEKLLCQQVEAQLQKYSLL